MGWGVGGGCAGGIVVKIDTQLFCGCGGGCGVGVVWGYGCHPASVVMGPPGAVAPLRYSSVVCVCCC